MQHHPSLTLSKFLLLFLFYLKYLIRTISAFAIFSPASSTIFCLYVLWKMGKFFHSIVCNQNNVPTSAPITTVGASFRLESSKLHITAVSESTRPARSKTSLDSGFFCDNDQNLKAMHFCTGPLRKQKFTSVGLKGHGL